MATESRKFDIIVLGATGFTGMLVAEYLLKTYGTVGELSWAMAGRSKSKLEKVRGELGNAHIPILIADSLNQSDMYTLAGQTRVLCTTVGPYAKYGSVAVAACIRQQTHYCDLSGETHWMRKMIDAHQKEAVNQKVKIVHSCGFDSIPSDMGVFFLQEKALAKTGKYCKEVKTGVKAAKGGFSGGTYASMSNIVEEARRDKSLYKILFDPYSLNPEGMREGPDKGDLRSVVFDKDFRSWKSPFIMSAINTRNVRRSHALKGFPYGKDFRYDEFILTGKGFMGRLKGIGMSLPLAIFSMAKPGSLLKKILDSRLPKPGEGPSKKEREEGFFYFQVLGKMADGTTLMAKIKGDMDPGYGSTSKMLGECAVALAKNDLPDTFGILTPSVAMGEKLLARLEAHAGLSFEMA